jgi:hypothetical protein
MKLSRTNINENYLSSHVVSITLAYFLNSPHSNLKYAIQFLLIQTPQDILQELKQTGLPQPPESVRVFFNCKKQIEITGGQMR